MIGTPYEEEFHSYNYSLPGDKFGMQGVDGLKTGSSPTGAFNAMITASRHGKRLITIVMGVGDWSDQDGEFYRHPFINALTENGFKLLNNNTKRSKHYKKIIPKEVDEADQRFRSSKKHPRTPQTSIEKIEHFVDHHHRLVILSLGIFVILILLLSLIAHYH